MELSRRVVGFCLISFWATGCDRQDSQGDDPYGPLNSEELELVITQSGVTPRMAGTESDPPPILDRPHAQYATEIALSKKAVLDSPLEMARREQLAVVYGMADRSDLALREYRVLLAHSPGSPFVQLRYAQGLFAASRDTEGALRHVRAAKALGVPEAGRPDVDLLLAMIAEEKEDGVWAARFYKAVVSATGGHDESLYRLGVLARARGDLAEARGYFTQTLARNGKHVAALYSLGRLERAEGQGDRGDMLLEKHARLRKLEALGYIDHPEAYQCFVLGNHHGMAGDYDQALVEFQRAVKIEPENLEAKAFVAITLLDLQRYQDALDLFQKVLQNDPREARSLVALADFHLASGPDQFRDDALGLEYARRAVVSTKERNARALGLLALALERAGNIDGARKALLKAREMEPASSAWDRRLEELESKADV